MAQEIKLQTNRIKELRKLRKLTQQQLAEKVGISYTHLGRIENGERGLDMEYIPAFAEALGVKPYEILPKEWQPEEISPEEREILHMIRKTTTPQATNNSNLSTPADNSQNSNQQAQPPHKTTSNGR